ncbi:MAG TPA: hypothetical protein VK839_03580, partial [Erythrobacter sp.]|nr:hypothetical protein [Erythrobacter sp.]
MAELANELKDAIEEGQRLRGWIANGYSQAEYLFGDLIIRSHGLPEYEAIKGRLPHRPERRIQKVRQILEIEGYFSQHKEEIDWLLAAFEHHQDVRHLLAHGFCTAYHTPD